MIKFKGSIIFLVAAGFLLMPLLADEIHDAAKAGNLNKVKILVTKDPSLVSAKTSRGTTPLHYACISKNVRLVKFLVSKGADVNALNASWYSPLHYAAAENRPEAVKSLIANGLGFRLN